MLLSVIIVNYNVKYFLEQCLCSVLRAGHGIDMEVWVVDNNSTDGSVGYLQPLFPQVNFIALEHNPGFAQANNLALERVTGEYVLFLNPDTIVPEECFDKCIAFMQQQSDAGALGIRMLDGSGKFLPESKRGFPSPLTSFFKLSGLAALFPSSRLFSRYYMGHLDKCQNHSVEVLAGAFMLFPKKVLNEIGGFDPIFFMYGEDIDLSYRVLQAGLRNYYFAESSIIHFKGESTRKGSLNYVRIFYQAMILFVKKHYKGAGEFFFRILLQMAIGLRAGISAIAGGFKKMGLPLADLLMITLVFFGVMHFWFAYVKPNVHPEPWVLSVAFPLFAVTLLLAGSLVGLYDKWYKPRRAFLALLVGVLIVLAAYSLLPEQYRFSRGVISVAGLLSAISLLLMRALLIKLKLLKVDDEQSFFKQTVVVGSNNDLVDLQTLLQQSGNDERLLGRLSINSGELQAIGSFENVLTLAKQVSFNEMIFCSSQQLPVSAIVEWIRQNPGRFRYKFHASGSHSLVGSDSMHKSGEVFSAASHFNLALDQYRRTKRIIDIIFALLFLITLPIQLLIQRKPVQALKNAWFVLLAKMSWVGYCGSPANLPALRLAVFACNGQSTKRCSCADIDEQLRQIINQRYAMHYVWTTDLILLAKNWRNFGA